MGYIREPFAVGEWYHCFNRGIDKRSVFESEDDSWRFLELLYLANDKKAIKRENFFHASHESVFQRPKEAAVVRIGAYCLMGNHFHILIQETEDGGISKFMHKVATGYTTYFNQKHDRIGNLFVKPFRSKHIGDDNYFYSVAQYIHLNPAELFEPLWKKGKVGSMDILMANIMRYPFSSLPDYEGGRRPQRVILDKESMEVIADDLQPLADMLSDAREYYRRLQAEYWNIVESSD